MRFSSNLHWNLDFTHLRQDFTEKQLFGLDINFGISRGSNLLTYEIKDNIEEGKDVYEELYDNYSGKAMIQQYREVAKDLGLPEWKTLEFGSAEEINSLYKISPGNIPIIQFVQDLLDQFPDRLNIICLNQDFEDATKSREVIANKNDLLIEIWQTIAFGYSWPNLRLVYYPPET